MHSYFKGTILAIFLLAFIFSTSFAQLTFIKDPANPVMSGSRPGTWDRSVQGPDVLYNADSARYEMWYFASAGPDANDSWLPFRMDFAVSEDGLHWTKYPELILESESDAWDKSFKRCRIIRENGQYKMWYVGGNLTTGTAGIGYATSPDGIVWHRDTLHNPVLQTENRNAWDLLR